MGIPPFGSAPTPPATTAKQGKVKLAGDLAGTADLPRLAAIGAGATVGSSTLVPVITYDTKGRITAATTAAITPGVSAENAYFLSC